MLGFQQFSTGKIKRDNLKEKRDNLKEKKGVKKIWLNLEIKK